MQLKPGKFCPLIKGDCVELDCVLFVQLRGTNPQTGQEVDEWLCSLAAMPMLTIENSQQQRQTAAAVESFRNEVVMTKRVDQLLEVDRALNGQARLG